MRRGRTLEVLPRKQPPHREDLRGHGAGCGERECLLVSGGGWGGVGWMN